MCVCDFVKKRRERSALLVNFVKFLCAMLAQGFGPPAYLPSGFSLINSGRGRGDSYGKVIMISKIEEARRAGRINRMKSRVHTELLNRAIY